MNGHDFRMFYENYARLKLAEFLEVDPKQVKHISLTNPTAPYDLRYKDIKYDAKYASPTIISSSKKEYLWDFDLRGCVNGIPKSTKNRHCDFYICVGLKNGIPDKVFLIPYDIAPKHHLRISIVGISKYHQYELVNSSKYMKSHNINLHRQKIDI